MLTPRLTKRGLAVIAVAAVAGLSLVAPGGAAASARSHPTRDLAKVGTHYAVARRLCAVAKPGFGACMAIRRVNATKRTPDARPYAVKSAFPVGPAQGLTPGDLATAYGYNPAVGGTGQVVGIVDAYDDPNINADLGVFDSEYGIAPEGPDTFIKVGETGSEVALPPVDTTGWSGEESLDVEAVRGACHACTIILVETNSTSDKDLIRGVKAAVGLGATEVSNSYGGPEGPANQTSKSARKKYQKAYTYPGVVITASTGDEGWFSWDLAGLGIPSAESPNVPASLPTVVSVGGTTLKLNANATRRSEAVWNDNGPSDSTTINGKFPPLGGTGGGCSVLYRADGWQAHVGGYAKTGCKKQRLAADVSADGDSNTGYDVYSSYDCGRACEPIGWQTIGGTSLSSPLIAAMWALAGGSGGVRYPALSLYGHARSATPPLYDVTKGGNSWCDADRKCAAHTKRETNGEPNPNDLIIKVHHKTVVLGTLDCSFKSRTKKPTRVKDDRQCNAAPGYDGPSGVGTPNGLGLFTPMSPKATFTVTGKVHGKPTAFVAGGRDPFPGGHIVSYAWSFGDNSGSGSSSPTAKHTYHAPGVYTVTLVETDNYGRASAVHSGAVTVS